MFWRWRIVASWLGLNPELPFLYEVKNPVHGQKAKNRKWQKVIYDDKLGAWVMPENFSDRPPVEIKK